MTTSSWDGFPRPLRKQVIDGVTHLYADMNATFETIDDCVNHLLDYDESITDLDRKIVNEYITNHEYLLNQRYHKKLPLSEVYTNFREYVFSEISFNIRKYNLPKILGSTKSQTVIDFLMYKAMLDSTSKVKSWEGLSCKTVVYWIIANYGKNASKIKRMRYRLLLGNRINNEC